MLFIVKPLGDESAALPRVTCLLGGAAARGRGNVTPREGEAATQGYGATGNFKLSLKVA